MTILGKALFTFSALAPSAVLALGIRIPDQDARAAARAGAFAATADNPSAVYYNPAGLTQIDQTAFRATLYGITLGSTYKSPAGGEFDTESDFHLLPSVFSVMPIKDLPLRFGFGTYAPYGLALKWSENTGFRTLGIEGSMKYMTANPVVAWEICPQLSIGAGVTLNYAQAELRQGLFAPFNDTRFDGDAFAVGYNAGVRWQPHEKHAFAVSYRSVTTMNFEGRSEVNANPPFPSFSDNDATVRFKFPQHVVAGYSFRPTENWNLEVNVDWTDWNRLNTVPLDQTFPDAELRFHWESSFMYSFGVTRVLPYGYSVSAGYMFSENSVPEATFSPLVPDSDRHIFNVGAGRTYEHWNWDIGYQFAYGPWRDVDNSPVNRSAFPPFPAESADGRYEFISHAFTFAIGYTF